MCREEKFMLYIILLFVVVVVYLMMLMRRQKEKMSEIKIQIDQLQAQHDRLQKERDQLQERMNHLEEQREHLQMQTDQAFRSADEIEKICDEIWHHANTIHLYSSLSECRPLADDFGCIGRRVYVGGRLLAEYLWLVFVGCHFGLHVSDVSYHLWYCVERAWRRCQVWCGWSDHGYIGRLCVASVAGTCN